MRVVSRVDEWIKDLGLTKYQKNLNTSKNSCLALSRSPELKILSVLAKNLPKNRSQTFPELH